MRALLRLIPGLVLAIASLGALAQNAVVVELTEDPPATLRVWNRDVIELRATVNGVSPAERVERARERILALPALSDPGQIAAQEAQIAGVSAHAVFVRNSVLFFVFSQDLDPTSVETMDGVLKEALSNLSTVLEARARQSRPQVLVRGVLISVGATVLMLAALWLIGRARRLVLRAAQQLRRRVPSQAIGVTLRGYLAGFEVVAARIVALAAALVVVYVWLAFVFSRFPYTAPWGAKLGDHFVGLLSGFAHAVVGAVPGLFAVLVIFLIARSVAQAVSRLLARVEDGRASVAGLDPETAKATRWVALTLIWLFAIVVAYPYIPGSDSLAFKGVSVFAGLMLTIGSSGFVGHILSGLIVVYSKALRRGEMVKVSDTVGIVSEVGAFSTRLVTARGEEVNIPNSVLIGTMTTNYSRLAGERGTLLTTTVTIGYDAPWRQVHTMLELAAERTPGLRREPKPYVLQRALGDFYVEYELRAHLEQAETWFAVQSELHARIQDVFNEYGVQIMSPHFMMQPENAVLVPKSGWYAVPAKQAEEGAGPDARAPT
jgi:small-conductance mechanosensitive channel